MKETEYVYAVARIRANENLLLSEQDLRQAVAASSYDEALRLFAQKGYEFGAYFGDALNDEMVKTWELLREIMPDNNELDFLIVKNDFHNLKAALKCLISGEDALKYFLSPSVIPHDELFNIVAEREFESLPDYMAECAAEAYGLLTRTMNGQLTEAVIDRAALEARIRLAGRSDYEELSDIANLFAAFADIKIAYRSVLTSKNRDFLEKSICECKGLKKAELIDAVQGGMGSLMDYLMSTPYSELAESLKFSATAFEKRCDDMIMEYMEKAKMTAFGVLPLAAYYLAKEAEVLSVRIILSAKLNNISRETVNERVRKLW